jgi:hypothetical protein
MGYNYMIGVDEISVEAVKLAVMSTYAKEVLKTRNAIAGAALVCQRSTKARCPVGTEASTHKKGYVGGTLKASYTKIQSLDGLESAVFTDTLYGKFVELGTYKMAAQSHLYPGFVEGAAYLMIAMGVPF